MNVRWDTPFPPGDGAWHTELAELQARRASAQAMGDPVGGDRLNHRFAWPSARWGSIPTEGGVRAAHKAEIEAATDPAETRHELEAHDLDMASPFRTAGKLGILDITDPRETRAVLCDWVEDAWHVAVGTWGAGGQRARRPGGGVARLLLQRRIAIQGLGGADTMVGDMRMPPLFHPCCMGVMRRCPRTLGDGCTPMD